MNAQEQDPHGRFDRSADHAEGNPPAGDRPAPGAADPSPYTASAPGGPQWQPSPYVPGGTAMPGGYVSGPVTAPPYSTEPAPPRPGRRGGRAVAAVAAAVAIALGAGGAGGFIGYSLADDDPPASSPSQFVGDGATLSDVAAAVQPSVVSVETETAGGSGVVYDDRGHIITNNHVVASAVGGEVTVQFADGTSAPAEVVGTDPAGDLAVLKVDDVEGLTPITVGDSEGLEVGDTVLALGSPLGLQGSVTSGIVSALDRTISAGEGPRGSATTLNGLIQTDAAINHGNSGGALVNGRGELIGINTAIATADSSGGNIGVGFAIPASTVRATADQIIEGGSVERAFLGVSMTDMPGAVAGAVVTTVQPGSPAEDAGLVEGDVITAIGDTEVSSAADVAAAVQSRQPGDRVEITYSRDGGTSETVTATLGGTP
ncbi:putative serine protease PepD [Stackebrandtia albiflava]|uniref:Putative serine protease PepD n=1 Tax=Stackebrandtia albiflava TaxID=406432 RepID=A0A562V5J2_9ACTN|nr:trypsin-like peptidase domain-containing protein [Stackebrandtia albiflava]TWJ13058.1 putative serine protease PepD [Stackebrandtia albiflava]